MNPGRITVACAALLGVVALASCERAAPPPPPKHEPPKAAAPVIDPALKRLAEEIYVYAFPLVLTEVTRQIETAGVPSDTFRHERTLPDATTTGVANPNRDFLYSQAWLDLSQGPVILSVPDTRGRYYLIAMLGAWSNVVASLGTRTTGTGRIKFALVGPNWKGKLPGGVSMVRSPTELAWLFARTRTEGGADLKAAAWIQDQFRISPLSGRRKGA